MSNNPDCEPRNNWERSPPIPSQTGLKTYGRILYRIAQQVINNSDDRRTCDYSGWWVEPLLEPSPSACCDVKAEEAPDMLVFCWLLCTDRLVVEEVTNWTPGFS